MTNMSFVLPSVCYRSPTNKSSLRESSRVKTGAAEKSAAAAVRADTKGRDNHGEMLCSIHTSV